MRTTRLAKQKKKKSLLLRSKLNALNSLRKVFNFLLSVAIQTAHVSNKSVQKTSRKTRRTILLPPLSAIVCYQEPAIISSLASCMALMTPEPRSSWNYGTSIIFAMQSSAELQHGGSWFTRQLRGWQDSRAANTIRWGRCCKSNPLLPPSTLSTKLPFTLSVVLTSLQL